MYVLKRVNFGWLLWSKKALLKRTLNLVYSDFRSTLYNQINIWCWFQNCNAYDIFDIKVPEVIENDDCWNLATFNKNIHSTKTWSVNSNNVATSDNFSDQRCSKIGYFQFLMKIQIQKFLRPYFKGGIYFFII